jgi:COMPASS component SWD3
MLVTTEIPVPLNIDSPPQSVISNTHTICKGAVLSLDFHPIKENLLLCGSMDHTSFIINVDQPTNPLVQMFTDHTKYVVRTLWSRNGEYFITSSYDRSICVYREDGEEYKLVKRIEMKGSIEALTMSKVSKHIIND